MSPQAWSCAYLGSDVTNNIAEYEAVIMALERIARRDDQNVRIEADSLLVVSQLNGAFGVRTPSLKPLFRHAISIIQRLRSRGITLEIHHIFRYQQ